MTDRPRPKTAAGFLLAAALFSVGPCLEARNGSSTPAGATQCDPSLPIRIELVPENEPRPGQTARFRVEVESLLDPDQVRDMRIEYRTSDRLRLRTLADGRDAAPRRSGRTDLGIEVVVPDESRYSVRARLIVEFTDGRTIAQTAVRWIDLGEEDPPEGMAGRIVDPDGTGIRVYQGMTVRGPR